MKALAACFVVTLTILTALAHLVAHDPKPIQLTVRPMVAFAPTDVQIKVRVHPEPDDRWIVVQTDSGEFARSSYWSIEGDRPLYSFWWTSVPAGSYEIVALLGHGSTVRASDRVSILVQGM